MRPPAACRLSLAGGSAGTPRNLPLLRPGLWADPVFRLGLALYLVFFSGVVPFFLYYSITLQYGLGYSALATAGAGVAYAAGSTITSLRSARIAARFTAPRTILAGCTISAAGNAVMIATIGGDSSGRYLRSWHHRCSLPASAWAW